MTLVRQESRPLLFFLPKDEAAALVDLGAALEPFIVQGSPADQATAHLDEQLAQQQSESRVYAAVRDALDDALWDARDALLPSHIEAATVAAINAAHGLYETIALEREPRADPCK